VKVIINSVQIWIRSSPLRVIALTFTIAHFHCLVSWFKIIGPTPPEPESRQCPVSEWWPAESNLYVSMLNGLPWGPAYPHLLKRNCVNQQLSISKFQYEMALQSLQENFDLVLTLDSFKYNASLVSCALKQVLGWSKTSMSKRNGSGGGKKLTIEPDVLEQIERGNYWDIQLYKQAQTLEAQFFSKLQNCPHRTNKKS
jgi:hypothetical protein